MCVKHRVPIMITSLRAPDAVVEAAHSYGGLVFHDVTTIKHAKRALEAGVDGLILVCTGAGGHAGRLSPFAFVPEVRQFYDGCVILSGSIASGGAILAAQALGADLAYIGTRFIASEEANAPAEYKQMIIDSRAEDIVYTNLFTGVHGNYLKGSIVNAGLDPENLPESDKIEDGFRSGAQRRRRRGGISGGRGRGWGRWRRWCRYMGSLIGWRTSIWRLGVPEQSHQKWTTTRPFTIGTRRPSSMALRASICRRSMRSFCHNSP